MDYYKLFDLKKDPFSTTPDPDFFFRSVQHARCLQQVEIAIRLGRGLSLVQGRVGTGKTTLCRRLIRVLSPDPYMEVHLMLDPGFTNTIDFAAGICEMLCGQKTAGSCSSLAQHREKVQHRLFEAGVEEEKTLVLIIDEGQKLASGSVEFLRELLNFETNEHKLLQIVIFAQDEISQVLEDHPNFSDRISLYYQLKPLDHRDTARLIAHRLIFANGGKKLPPAPVFTTRTVKKIYKLSRGYPRRIIYLSYQAMLLLLIKGGSKITPDIIIQASKNLPSMDGHSSAGKKSPWAYAAATAMVGLIIGAIGTAAYKSQPYFKDTNRTPEVVAQRSAPEKIPEQNKSFLKAIQPAPAALQEQKPAVAKRPARQQDLPAYLGHIRIQAGQRLWDAAGKVYGRVTPAILKKIQIANPDLTDPDKIRVGQKIRLPVTDPKTPDQDQLWWIALEISSELEPVFRIITHGDNGDLGLLSFWSPDRGMFHAAVAKQQFSGPEAVEAAMAELEQTAFTRAKIIDLSKDGICLLTSPSFSDTKPVEVNN